MRRKIPNFASSESPHTAAGLLHTKLRSLEKCDATAVQTLLRQTLQEEKDTDDKLTQLADKMKVLGGIDSKGQTARA
jgi:hypothetical protein